MHRLPTKFVLTLALMAVSAPVMWAQSTSDQNAGGAPPAATGLDTTTQMSENPPLSGLDQPSFEPGFGNRSYLAPKVELSEALDTNSLGNFSTSDTTESTRALGSLDLQKLWKLHPFDLDYVGGVDWYNGAGGHVYQVHSLAATQRFLWRTGQLAVRDSFSYLPEGAFGFGSFGGAGAFGAGGLGAGFSGGSGNGIFSNVTYGAIGTQVTNMGIADVTQYLSPRSSVVLTGGYGLTDFLTTPKTNFCPTSVNCYFNSQEAIGQLAYNHQISRHDQVALVYAYQELHFPGSTAGSLNVDLWQVEYGHRISGKLDLLIGGGPEWVHRSQSQEEFLGVVPTGLPCTNTSVLLPCVNVKSSFVTGSGQVSVRYRVSALTNFSVTYLRFISSGSGFFGGAKTDTGRFNINHLWGRHWTVLLDTGYSHNTALLGATSVAAGAATSYSYWYFGGAAHRRLGRHFGVFGSYQYNAFAFGSSCTAGAVGGCGSSYGRNVLLLGLNWTPQPIRLD
ncbi:MAG TPA: hypothetical protein VHV29_09375 [Terriglobales bacterium]|nr:hypothetical protein [Terriglobales bacterium]